MNRSANVDLLFDYLVRFVLFVFWLLGLSYRSLCKYHSRHFFLDEPRYSDTFQCAVALVVIGGAAASVVVPLCLVGAADV